MTTFRIKETGEIKTLNLVDPKTGCCWLNEAMAGDSNITPFECDDDYEGEESDVDCNQETFDWWENFTSDYQKADEKWNELVNNADNEKQERMMHAHSEAFSEDMEMYPAILNELCDQFGSMMVIAEDSCNGEEKEFEVWMNKNHPDIETKIENTMDSGLFDSDGELDEHNDQKYWDGFCSR